MHCPRCKANFKDSQKLAEHIMEFMATSSCQDRPSSDEATLPWSQGLVDSFKARVDSSLTLGEQWFSVWRIVFPGVELPASCWVDDHVCQHVMNLQRFVFTKGHSVVCISRLVPVQEKTNMG